MFTTDRRQEKCIDIALAVEMMHYAALPDAYDIAVRAWSGGGKFILRLIRDRWPEDLLARARTRDPL